MSRSSFCSYHKHLPTSIPSILTKIQSDPTVEMARLSRYNHLPLPLSLLTLLAFSNFPLHSDFGREMEVMESPIEVLVFTYSGTAATSLWTWLAVVTAAFGLWRIRTIASLSAPSRPIFKQVASGPITDAHPPPLPTTEMQKPLASPNVEVCVPKYQIASPEKGTVFKSTFGGEPSLGDNLLLPSGICFEEDFCVKLSSKAHLFRDSSSVGRTSSVQAPTREDEDDGFDGSGSCSYESNDFYWLELRNGIFSNGWVEFYRFQDWTVLNGNVVRLWEKDFNRRGRWSD